MDGRSSNGVFQRYNRTLETLTTQTQLTYIKTFGQNITWTLYWGLKQKTSRIFGCILMVLNILVTRMKLQMQEKPLLIVTVINRV